MSSLTPPPYLTSELLSRHSNLQHGFFTRKGGVSRAPYDSLNLSHSTQDSPENIAQNKARIAHCFNLPPSRLIQLKQIHSAKTLTLTKDTLDDILNAPSRPEADALVTNVKSVVLSIVTADCVPLLMTDAKASVICALHAGWRGALFGIIESALTAMQSLNAKPERISAALGPAISVQSYQVDADFKTQFVNQDSASQVFFNPAQEKNKYQFDLKAYCVMRLKKQGVNIIETLDYNTYDRPDLFFSHRYATRHNQKRGLQITACSWL